MVAGPLEASLLGCQTGLGFTAPTAWVTRGRGQLEAVLAAPNGGEGGPQQRARVTCLCQLQVLQRCGSLTLWKDAPALQTATQR